MEKLRDFFSKFKDSKKDEKKSKDSDFEKNIPSPIQRNVSMDFEPTGMIELFPMTPVKYNVESHLMQLTETYKQIVESLKQLNTAYLNGLVTNITNFKKNRVILNKKLGDVKARIQYVEEILMQQVQEDEHKIIETIEYLFLTRAGKPFFQILFHPEKSLLNDAKLMELDIILETLSREETPVITKGIKINSLTRDAENFQLNWYHENDLGICVLTREKIGSVIQHKMKRVHEEVQRIVQHEKYSEEHVQYIIKMLLLSEAT